MGARFEYTIEELENEIERLNNELDYYRERLKEAKDFEAVVKMVDIINELIYKIRKMGFSIDLENYKRKDNEKVIAFECDIVYKTINVIAK